VWELILMGLLLGVSRRRPFAGATICAYALLEGLGRLALETWRGDDDRGLWLGVSWLSTGRVTGAALVVAGCVLYAVWHPKEGRNPAPTAGPASSRTDAGVTNVGSELGGLET
jgi:prolipoprotein diacylglyceryltransferase